MTAPLDYLLANRCCLLCAQTGCAHCYESGREGEGKCSYCKGTGSLLVPIAEHPVDHEHVELTLWTFLGYFAMVRQTEPPYERQDVHILQWGLGYEWKPVQEWGQIEPVWRNYELLFDIAATHTGLITGTGDGEEYVIRAFIEHGYAEAEGRVRG